MTEHARFPDVMLLTAGNGQALWPVAGVPLIERVLATAKAEGAKRVVANGLAADHGVLAHFGGLVKVSRQDAPLGSGGGVRQALPMLYSDPILVLETSSFWLPEADAPFGRMIARHEGAQDIVLLCVHPRDAVGFGRSHDFCLSPRGEVTRDSGAPVIFAGATLLGKSLFDTAPEGMFSLDLLIDAALERETLYGVVLDAPWFSVTDTPSLARVEADLAK